MYAWVDIWREGQKMFYFQGGGLPYEGGNFLGGGSYPSVYYVQYIKSNEASRVLEMSKCTSISNQLLE